MPVCCSSATVHELFEQLLEQTGRHITAVQLHGHSIPTQGDAGNRTLAEAGFISMSEVILELEHAQGTRNKGAPFLGAGASARTYEPCNVKLVLLRQVMQRARNPRAPCWTAVV